MAAEERAERLRILLDLGLGAPHLPPADLVDELAPADFDLIATMNEEDRQLANACLQIEAELRARAFAAAECLGRLIAAGEGAWTDRVKSLPEPELTQALAAVLDLEWVTR